MNFKVCGTKRKKFSRDDGHSQLVVTMNCKINEALI